jgi:hypothetical protein
MEFDPDPPPGHPDPPPEQRPTAPISFILSLLLVAAIAAFIAHYLGWL